MVLAAILLFGTVPGTVLPVGEAFAKIAGRTISPQLAETMVYASDPATLESRLPRVLEATWQPTKSGGRRLERTRAQDRFVRAQDAATIRTSFETSLKTQAPLPTLPFDASLGRALVNRLGTTMDSGSTTFGSAGVLDVLHLQLLTAMIPALSDELPYASPAIYALPASLAERPLPTKGAGLIAAYPEVEREFARRYAEGSAVRLERWNADRTILPGTRWTDDPAVGRTILDVYRGDDIVVCNLVVYGRDGAKHAYSDWYVTVIHTPATPFRFSGEAEPLPVSVAPPSLAASGGEPLAVSVAPALDALSARLGTPVVAALPDAAAIEFAKPIATLGEAVRALEKTGLQFGIEDGVLVGRPVDLARFGHQNVVRPALRRWTRAMHDPATDWLRAWSRLYAESPDVAPLGPYLRERVLPAEGFAAPPAEMGRSVYHLLGQLSDDEWRRLMSGRPIALGSDASRRTAASTVMSFLQRTDSGERLPDVALRGSWSFPAGPPATTTITMNSGGVLVARTGKRPEWEGIDVIAGNDFDFSKLQTEVTLESADRALAARRGDDTIEFGHRGQRAFVFDPGSGLRRRQEQSDPDIRSDGPRSRLRDAPLAAREQLLAQLKEIAKDFEKDAGAPPP